MPQATVAAIITRTEQNQVKVLLTRRNHEPYEGYWSLPGGHIEPGETALAAVIREVKEETGLDFDAAFFKACDEIIPERKIHAVVQVFHGAGRGGLSLQPEEVAEAEWVVLDEAVGKELAFQHAEILRCFAACKISPETRSEMLAEYAALRAEIVQRIDLRQQILTFSLAIAGSLISIGVQSVVSPLVLLVSPILALFLASLWKHCDMRIWEIGRYIQTHIEQKLDGIGWEQHSYQSHQTDRIRAQELSATGIFILTQVVAIAVALPRLSYSVEEIILLASSGVALVTTWFLLQQRRRAMQVGVKKN